MTLTRRASSVLIVVTAALAFAAGPASAVSVTCVTVESVGAGSTIATAQTTRCVPTP